MQCTLQSCYSSMLLGILMPLIICIVFYLILVGYIIFITDKHYSIDIKEWKNHQLEQITNKFEKKKKSIELEIAKIS